MTEINGTIKEQLYQMQDPAYREFQSALIPTVDAARVLGVRVPALRRLARKMTRDGTAATYLQTCILPHETYDEEIKKTPAVGSLVETSNGNGVITEINPLAGLVRVKLTDKPEAPKYYPRDEVKMLMTAKQRKAENAARNGGAKVEEEPEEENEEIITQNEVTVTADPSKKSGENTQNHHKKHYKKFKKKPKQGE